MTAGNLRCEITIEKPVQSGSNGYNEPIYTWENIRADGKKIWASIEARRGMERADPKTNQRYNEVNYQFTVRYNEAIGVTEQMRILYNSQTYQIEAIMPIELRRNYIMIQACLQDSTVT